MPSCASCAALAVRPWPRDGLDQIAALGADPPSEPKREAIGGETPGFLDVGALGDQGVRRPDGHGPLVERGAQLGLRSRPRRSPAATPPPPRQADPWRAAPCGGPMASPKPSWLWQARTSSAKAPPPGTTTMGRGAAAIASSQAVSSAERTTLPPSLTTMGRASAARGARLALARTVRPGMVRRFPWSARSRRRRRRAPCRASRS